MEDPAILSHAMGSMAAELERRVPTRWQVSFYSALRDAEAAKRRFSTEQSRRAGSAEKTDALQMVHHRDRAGEQVDHLRPTSGQTAAAQEPGGLIEDIGDEEIAFVDAKGRGKSARISGLKDRLSRARKKVDRRIEKGESR